MRIVAGSARGMRLKTPGFSGVRPMADRVRQSLFDKLSDRVMEANVLDAFAGTGALGLEALSRGARHSVFVERDPRCVAIIRENIEHTRLAERATVICCDIFGSLGRLRELKLGFDLLLFDPPFALFSSQEGWGKLFGFMGSLLDGKLVEDEALFVVEHRIKDASARPPTKLHEVERRKYGERALTFFAAYPAKAVQGRDNGSP